jgi:hypothetical protein
MCEYATRKKRSATQKCLDIDVPHSESWIYEYFASVSSASGLLKASDDRPYYLFFAIIHEKFSSSVQSPHLKQIHLCRQIWHQEQHTNYPQNLTVFIVIGFCGLSQLTPCSASHVTFCGYLLLFDPSISQMFVAEWLCARLILWYLWLLEGGGSNLFGSTF